MLYFFSHCTIPIGDRDTGFYTAYPYMTIKSVMPLHAGNHASK